jgi:hypothetical protein
MKKKINQQTETTIFKIFNSDDPPLIEKRAAFPYATMLNVFIVPFPPLLTAKRAILKGNIIIYIYACIYIY